MALRPALGLNRFDPRSVDGFAADVKRAEALGWAWAFIPSSPLARTDPYVNLAAAARVTTRMRLGPLIENPVMRHPAVIASSMATLDTLAAGRTLLGYGAGDTAVRFMGKKPATVARLEEAVVLTRRLLAGERIDVGAARPARLQHARPIPVWVAAGGMRTLRMAGRAADGVFIRAGTHPANLRAAVAAVRAGEAEAGREQGTVRLGLVVHTILSDDAEATALMARSIAAGYYEYSPGLFDAPGFTWHGPDIHDLKRQVWPDFHHAADLEASGRLVSFLPDEVASAFSFHGNAAQVASQIEAVLGLGIDFDILVPHPIPNPAPDGPRPDYMERFITRVWPLVGMG